MSGVAINNWSVAHVDFSGVVHNDYLRFEGRDGSTRVLGSITGNVTALQVFHSDILYIEPNAITRNGLRNHLMVHLNALYLGGDADGSKLFVK